ncbi:MAG: HAD family hydrolase [Candidatus Omnitrophica bacterium]|nr:HAD family hydrolase [Candidatus Omnitrophota bacterium]
MQFKVIALDFDGTLVESVGIKDKAFEDLFKNYPDKIDEIMRYHLANNATIRYTKFKYITEHILNKTYTQQLEDQMCAQYSDYVLKSIIACPYVDGAMDFLDYFYDKVPMYIATVNPKDEFMRILNKRGIAKYFKDVYAYPWVKVDTLKDIAGREGVSLGDMVFIGDTPEDLKSAQDTETFFIGRDSKKPFGRDDVPIFNNMAQVQNFLLNN